ncbi:hypothetical protein VTK73DRAFT_4323 [Phialemonium thermophilum]|uniref:Uncharacterized protein n=1 Tax=Phialemonium thermophilum TaxID=223376 RepID=A0ABR3V9K9_9PEZI
MLLLYSPFASFPSHRGDFDYLSGALPALVYVYVPRSDGCLMGSGESSPEERSKALRRRSRRALVSCQCVYGKPVGQWEDEVKREGGCEQNQRRSFPSFPGTSVQPVQRRGSGQERAETGRQECAIRRLPDSCHPVKRINQRVSDACGNPSLRYPAEQQRRTRGKRGSMMLDCGDPARETRQIRKMSEFENQFHRS